MHAFLKGAALALAMAATPVVAQQLAPPVIVIVDMDRVVNESAAGKQASTEIQGRITGIQSRANQLQTQLKTDAEQIQAGQKANTLTGPALEQRARAFEDKRQAGAAEIDRMQNELGRSRQFVIQQITTAANPIITAIMRERGASIALAEGATLQHGSSLDVTSDVIARLNTSLPRVSTTPPAQPAGQTPAQPR
jgi:Skp family chaperone for outer membrane proteins